MAREHPSGAVRSHGTARQFRPPTAAEPRDPGNRGTPTRGSVNRSGTGHFRMSPNTDVSECARKSGGLPANHPSSLFVRQTTTSTLEECPDGTRPGRTDHPASARYFKMARFRKASRQTGQAPLARLRRGQATGGAGNALHPGRGQNANGPRRSISRRGSARSRRARAYRPDHAAR